MWDDIGEITEILKELIELEASMNELIDRIEDKILEHMTRSYRKRNPPA